MTECDRCGKTYEQSDFHFQLQVTAKMKGRPIPFFFDYCTHDCMFNDMVIKIIPIPKKKDDAE